MKYVAPSVHETAFNCPHCRALAKQDWFTVHAHKLEKDATPFIIDPQEIAGRASEIENTVEREHFRAWFERCAKRLPFLEPINKYCDASVYNMWFSRCFNCNDIALWIHDRLVYPLRGEAPPINPDAPEDIRRDYEEASAILDLSPRGAAALIRLSVQKLCKELGQPGNNINDDIGALVANGLDPRVQQALDVVRVIGNEAVHPGQIDLRDDRSTAEILFKLLNMIIEKTISEPKHVAEIYSALPSEKLKAIEKRDSKLGNKC